jgi:hypothetical protein
VCVCGGGGGGEGGWGVGHAYALAEPAYTIMLNVRIRKTNIDINM